jgi:hypothetical protein
MMWGLNELDYADDRELRLYACWCVRLGWDRLTDPRSRAAVEVVERYARGEATADEFTAARAAARDAARDALSDGFVASDAARAAFWAAAGDAEKAAWVSACGDEAALLAQADELRQRIPWLVVEELLRKQTKAVPE